jgi:hypothetical protein
MTSAGRREVRMVGGFGTSEERERTEGQVPGKSEQES